MDDSDGFDLEQELLQLEADIPAQSFQPSVHLTNENVIGLEDPSLPMPTVSLGDTVDCRRSATINVTSKSDLQSYTNKTARTIPGPAGNLPSLTEDRKTQLLSLRRKSKASSVEMRRFFGLSDALPNQTSNSNSRVSALDMGITGESLNSLRSKLGVSDFRLYQLKTCPNSTLSQTIVVEMKEILHSEGGMSKVIVRDETAEVVAVCRVKQLPEPSDIFALSNVPIITMKKTNTHYLLVKEDNIVTRPRDNQDEKDEIAAMMMDIEELDELLEGF